MADDFERMWTDLRPVGRSAVTGGYFRQPFGAAERECHAWFVEQALARDLRIEDDGNANTIAWWEPDGVPHAGAVLTGSHLDSVRDGGGYDGPLGVVSALAAVDLLRARGVQPGRRIGIAVFAEEEGSRFGPACLGSRLAVGALSAEQARGLRDPDGVGPEEAMAAVGLCPDLGPSAWLDGVGCYLELHVEQGRGLVELDRPVGLAAGIWPHGRYRIEITGAGNHAGTTLMTDRQDPMLTAAMTVLAANKQARLAGARATVGRLQVEPNATNAVPRRVTAWLDARAASEPALQALVAAIDQQGAQRAGRDGTGWLLTAESVSPAVDFDPGLIARLAGDRPVLPTAAGHDAGVLAAAGIPSAMLFVRNPTGISHAPEEYAGTQDCLSGVTALADALTELTR